jgi:hypothetical protein
MPGSTLRNSFFSWAGGVIGHLLRLREPPVMHMEALLAGATNV